MSLPKAPYHHGDLSAALVRAALELLEEDGADALSLRAVARRAGVSAAAPYRHYADREALVSAVAAVGYHELTERLVEAHPLPTSPEELGRVATAYVQFALERPALFRIMFAEPCDRDNGERVVATAALAQYVRGIVERTFTAGDPDALTTAIWALVHGLAFLYLDGKLDATTPTAVADRIAASVQALLRVTRPT